MRLVTWNCRVGGFRKKARHISPLRPDILAVQEVEPLDNVVLFAGDCQPTFRDRIRHPVFPRRGIGVFSYTDVSLIPVDVEDPMHAFRRYRAVHNGHQFQVVALWTAATSSSKTAYRQAIEGVDAHASWIRQQHTVIMGDFNSNACFKSPNWRDLLDRLQPLELVSAYHVHTGEPCGQESRHTYFHRGKQNTSAAHLDYCFIPRAWRKRITDVTLGTYEEWRSVSDHVPLIVDLDL